MTSSVMALNIHTGRLVDCVISAPSNEEQLPQEESASYSAPYSLRRQLGFVNTKLNSHIKLMLLV